MSGKIEFSFSETFRGVVWKTLADPLNKRMFIESRDNETKRVAFSAVDLESNIWFWKEITFDEEPWWISLAEVSGDVLLFTIYTDENNPDEKTVFAFDVREQKILWWRNNFALSFISHSMVRGVDTKFGRKEICLRLSDGLEATGETFISPEQNLMIVRPFHYHEGSVHFETIRSFLEAKSRISPVISIEYSEYNSLILISAFSGSEDLANYLIVFNSSGQIVMNETLGEHLKGIALDTFFIFSGYLIFVKNKRELVSYRFI